MKSILFVYHASNIGGGTYCLLNILKVIDRTKYQPIVLLRENGDLVDEIMALGIKVYFMPSMTLVPYNKPLWGRKVLYSYIKIKKSISDFEKLLESINPNAVYINTMMLAPYLEVAKRKGCRTVIHLREHWPLFEHVKQLSRVQNIISNCADTIVAINSYSASMISNRKATIIYDWIDLSSRYMYRKFDDIFGEDTSNLKVYLFTGGIQKIKGTAEIVEFFNKKIIGKNKRLLMVGVDNHPEYKGLKNLIKYIFSKFGIYTYEHKVRRLIKLDNRIVCIPATYYIKHIMQQAYCNLSFFTIPHANLALAESIIVGTVPVAVKTEESIEYSNGGELAVLFELGNLDDLYEKLKNLDENYDTIKSKIVNDNHIVKNMFDKERNVSILNKLLDELLEI